MRVRGAAPRGDGGGGDHHRNDRPTAPPPSSHYEPDSKADKVARVARDRRSRCLYHYVPRAACCGMCLLFLLALSYRLTDRVILPGKHSGFVPHAPLTPRSDGAADVVADVVAGATTASKGNNHGGLLAQRTHGQQVLFPAGAAGASTKTTPPGHRHTEHGRLLDFAKYQAEHSYGPRVPHRLASDPNRRLSKLEKQGHVVIRRINPTTGREVVITKCKEYLGDHIHCRPTLDMTELREVQVEWQMSEQLFKDTIAKEKKAWSSAFEVGLDTHFMRQRLIEVAHNFNLHHRKRQVKDYKDVSSGDQSWRYKAALRRAYYKTHDRATVDQATAEIKRELTDPKLREELAARTVTALRLFYRNIGKDKHDTTVHQIVEKYVRRHDLLEHLIKRLETRYGTEKVAEFLYPVRAGRVILQRTGKWPGTGVKKPKDNTTRYHTSEAEMAAVNHMFDVLRRHREGMGKKNSYKITRQTCLFSHTNMGSPCREDHPCAKIEHHQRTRSIIVKCFWTIAKPYCAENRRHASVLVVRGAMDGGKDPSGAGGGKTSAEKTHLRALPAGNEGTAEGTAKETGAVVRSRALERVGPEAHEDDADNILQQEEYDAACDHVVGESAKFAAAIAWYEAQGLKPELDQAREAAKKKKDEEEAAAERRRAELEGLQAVQLPQDPDGEDDDEREQEQEEDKVYDYGSLEDGPPKNYEAIHSLLQHKKKKRKVEGGLMRRLKKWYKKHGLVKKAQDKVHLAEIAHKYIDHEDLLFKRLHLKYHFTK